MKTLNFSKLRIILCMMALLAFGLFFVTRNLNDTRYITPPNLESAHLSKRILCHRPMRTGAPQMSIEIEKNGKVILHNYGHGGSGWTLAPGSAGYVNGFLETSKGAANLEKTTPITIIGAGVIGFFTAYDLIKKGYTNITIVAEKFENLTSHNAGGLLAPVSMDNDPKMQKIITKIGIDAYKFYQSIAKGSHEDFKDGAVIVPAYFEKREDSGLEPYVGVVMQSAKDVVLDFKNGTKRNMVAYDDGIFIDTTKMMARLSKFLKNKKVKFKNKKITSFHEIESKFIINCSGMGSASLKNDHKMISVQGHLIMLKNQIPENLQHMILVYYGHHTTKSGHAVKRSFYMFPKHLEGTSENDVGVIGGTFIENATVDTPNEEEFNIMIEGAKRFYGML
ncbi:MAG: FAD-dependent oxidoreductase [Candidatus Paracaedibacteraceae bacterium]|nr:FAD-dependent oxidoreductase [Candidatus Paracaedibacteraceae bacterium]